MAGNIKKIVLQNFKAFNGVNEIDLEGKHLLLYGENGSGKSSIYWGLYTLLQSITKDSAQTDKYFDFLNDENLINKDYIFHLNDTIGSGLYNSSIGKNVQIEIVQEDDKVLNLSLGGLSAATNKTELENLNRYSDFLTHRLLINFYNFRNSQEIDLWKVFTRDIFPFVYEDLDNGVETIENLVNELNNTQPFTVNATGQIVPSIVQQDYFDYYSRISYVNNEIYKWVKFIENEANQFFNEYFDENKNNFIINLDYTDRLYYNFHKTIIKNNSAEFEVMSSYKYLRTPKIILKIFKKVKNHWTPITRPQTFLNEALITQISLSIRLALTKSRAVNYPGQFLVLDDLLVSLDMSNRDKVLEIILNVFAPKFKIYILTHERSFFYYALDKLRNKGIEKEWLVKEIFADEINKKPFINDLPNKLKKAEYFLLNHDYPACGIYLRIRCEEILDNLYPDKEKYKLKLNNDGVYETQFQNLNDKISNLEYFCNQENIDYSEFKDLKTYKSVILNSLAHNDIKSPLYRVELIKVKDVLTKLEKYKRTISLFKPQSNFTLNIKKSDGKDYIIGLTTTDHIKLLEKVDEYKRASNFCKLNVTYINDDGVEQKNLKIEELSFKTLIDKICLQLGVENNISLENDLIYRNGSTILDKINALPLNQ
jgi:ABC-type Mn2+/Zn2+ transport system ATPase subunit